MHFGDYIKQVRKENNLSLDKLAERSDLSKSYLSRLENNKRKTPNRETILKLSQGLKIESEKLFKEAGYVNEDEKERIVKMNEALKTWDPGKNFKQGKGTKSLDMLLYSDAEKVMFKTHELTAKEKEKIYRFIQDFIIDE